MFHRQAALCLDGWKTSRCWWISCSVLHCKRGVMKRCAREAVNVNVNMLCALYAFVTRPQSRAPQVTGLIWCSMFVKYVTSKFAWEPYYEILMGLFSGKCLCLSVYMPVQRNTTLALCGAASSLVCKQSCRLLFIALSFKRHFMDAANQKPLFF